MKTIEMNNTTINSTNLSSDIECDNMEVRSYVGPVETFQALGEQNRHTKPITIKGLGSF